MAGLLPSEQTCSLSRIPPARSHPYSSRATLRRACPQGAEARDRNESSNGTEAGDPSAQVKMGNMYALGRRVTRNSQEAVKWFQKAADQGDAQQTAIRGQIRFIRTGSSFTGAILYVPN
jgi:hypothetical protein